MGTCWRGKEAGTKTEKVKEKKKESIAFAGSFWFNGLNWFQLVMILS